MSRTKIGSTRHERRLEALNFSWEHWRAVPSEPVACCVCGGRTTVPFVTAEFAPGDVVRCTGCGMVFVSPVRYRGLNLSAEQREEAERLRDSSDLRDLDGWWEMQFLDGERLRQSSDANYRELLEKLVRHRPGRGRLLDFGAGWGFFVRAAAADHWDAVGIEPQPGRALYAREALGLDVRSTTLLPGSFAPESFDAVIALQVFEHLDDPAAELDRIAEVLRPGGVLAIEVPSIASPLVKVLRGRHRHFDPDHFWFFSPDTLPRFVRSHGFRVRECYSPTRRLTVGWISRAILSRYLPAKVSRELVRGVEATGLSDRVVGVNVREIVMVIAEKQP
ncbi:MAG: class I SAM-dependent methyltransferase [Acidimicrobiia bacterium]